MLLKSDTVHKAWAATQRTVGVKLTIKETEYDASDITSLTFDSGAMNGEALTLGSTYQNTIKVVFSNLIEGLALTDEITPELGIKLPDGTWDYTPLGVFVIDAEVQQDRNNNTTTVSASDRMCMLGGTYESKLTYPAAISDIAVEIANLAAVKINEDDFARLPTGKVASFGKVTYRDAIGFVAQFAGGFATFDRDGLLDIRQLADPNFEVAPSQYQSKGLTKNEALYRIGGIACTVTTTTTDDSGTETQDTKTLQSGSSAGTQITISNPGMTQDLLDGLYEQLQDLNFYPFSLSWFDDPNLEAGDWIEVQDTAGNTFKTPNLLYALTFSGGVTATSKADTTVSASANFVYKGQLNQVVNNIRQYLNASGHAVSEGIDEPKNPKAGDIWFKKDGPDKTIMTYVVDPETGIGSWSEGPSTKPDTKITDALQQAEDDVAAAQKQADNAVAQALAAVNASGLATASAQAASDAAAAAKQLATEVSDTMATVQSQATTAASDAATALDQAKSALATANGVSGDYTTLKKIVDDTTATVSTLATQTSVDAVKQTVTTTQALAEQTANGLTLKADTTVVDTINNTVKQQGLDLKAAQDQLALTLTASDLTKGLSGYATQTWAQQQINITAQGLQAQLTSVQTDVNNIQVGGTNLLLGTMETPRNFTYTQGWGVFRNYTNSNSLVAVDSDKPYVYRTWIEGANVPYIAEIYTVDATGKNIGYISNKSETVQPGEKGFLTVIVLPENMPEGTKYLKPGVASIADQPAGNYTVSVGKDKLEQGTIPTAWSPAPEDQETYTDTKVADLKLTVDGLSATFAKQSDLNTATAKLDVTANGLSAIAAVTGADGGKVTQVIADVNNIQTTMTGVATSSQITQLQNDINLRVTKDEIISQINLTAGKTLIQNNSIYLDASTVIMGGTAFIEAANIKSVNADQIIAGTLNAGLLNVIGLNADSIATGTITGANLAINLNTGQVTFQSGRIHDTANYVDINIDPSGLSSYLSVANSNNRVILKGGQMQFIAPTLFDLQTSPYLSISNDGIGSNWAGATIVGRDSIMLANSANVGSSIMTWELGLNTFSGLFSGKNSNGTWNPTILGGAERGVVIVGGPLDDGTVQSSPMIRIGSSTDGQSAGNRIYVRSSYLIVPSIYSKTTGSSANVVVLSDGSLHRSTSASKYKTMIERSRSTDMAEALLTIPTAHWLDKAELTNYANGEQSTAPKQYFGMIAEDLASAGLEDLVVRGDTGELEGINYDRIAPALLPLLARMKQEIEELKGEK